MLLAPEEKVIEHEIRGAPWRLLKDLLTYNGPRVVKEAVLDGPGGTGKSRGLGHVFYALMDRYPGLRILVTRKTRESLTDSFLQTWEDDVVPPNHPMLSGASRNNRHNYLFGNGSEMVLGGMDKPAKLYSTSFDIWYCQELFEFTEDEWQRARRALRKWSHPELKFQLLVGDTNPDAEDHWINVRFQEGKTQRYQSRHVDNPALWDAVNQCWQPEGSAYLESLDSLKFSDEVPGVLYRRLRLGEWCSAEGVVWETFDQATNEIDRPELATKQKEGESDADFRRRCALELATVLDIRWFFAAVDWGFTEPGSLSVYGVDGDKRIYLVAHIYRTGQDIPVWANWAVELHREFTLRAIVCDPSRPDAIASFNDALGVPRDGPMRIARGANNAKTTSGVGDMAGLDGVRVRFRKAGDGKPRLMFLRDSLRFGRDEKLAKEKKPYYGPREVPSYIYLARDDGRPTKEQTDPRCSDHFCDELRYACAFVDGGYDLAPLPAPTNFPPTSYGAQLGHDKLLRKRS